MIQQTIHLCNAHAPTVALNANHPQQRIRFAVAFAMCRQCHNCTMINTITVPRCRACNTRNPHYDAIRPASPAIEDQLIGGPIAVPIMLDPAAPYSRATSDWECTRCHARNPNVAMTCNTCRTSRLLSLPLNSRQPARATGAATEDGGTVAQSTSANGIQPPSSSRSRIGIKNPFRGKNPWECESCHKIQQRELIRCRRCGAINGQAIVNRAQAEQDSYGGYGGGPGMMPMCSIM